MDIVVFAVEVEQAPCRELLAANNFCFCSIIVLNDWNNAIFINMMIKKHFH